jgi:hypothetical protein
MKNRKPYLHYVIAASLGSGADPTGIAVVEQEMTGSSNYKAVTKALRMRHLERLPTDANYPDAVTAIGRLLASPDIAEAENCGGADVVLDVTDVGRQIVELFQREGIKPVIVTVTGATEAEDQVERGIWRVPKVELVGGLRVAWEDKRLKMAEGVELMPELLDELRNFQMRPKKRLDLNDPESWRDSDRDDLVLASAVGVWWTGKNRPVPKGIRDAQTRRLNEHFDKEARRRSIVGC